MHGGSATCRRVQSLKEAAVLPGLPHSSQRSTSPAPPSRPSSEQDGQASPLPTPPAWPRVPTLPLPSERSGAATLCPGPCSREKTVGVGEASFLGGKGVVLSVTPVGTPIYAPPALRTLGAKGGELPRAGEALNGQGTTTSSQL